MLAAALSAATTSPCRSGVACKEVARDGGFWERRWLAAEDFGGGAGGGDLGERMRGEVGAVVAREVRKRGRGHRAGGGRVEGRRGSAGRAGGGGRQRGAAVVGDRAGGAVCER